MKRVLSILLLLPAIAAFPQKRKDPVVSSSAQPETIRERAGQELLRLSEISGGKLGLSAVHIESGSVLSQYDAEGFPMASTYKIPIAIQLLTRVDSGLLHLDQMIELTSNDLHWGSGMITGRFNWPNTTKPGVALSVRSLLELMLLISDNSATDICLRLAGGPERVNAKMRRSGVSDVSVNRSTLLLIGDFLGVSLGDPNQVTPAFLDSLEKSIPPEQEKAAALAFEKDSRDNATPSGMTQLLIRLHKGELLSPASTRLLLDIMTRCETGAARLKGLLPIGTVVAHKTGTIGMSTNDVGIITLPSSQGHVAISVFVKSSRNPIPDRERAIAEVTRMVYDYFLLRP